MAKPQSAADLRKQIAEHQANLVRLGEAWGQRIVDELDDADRATIARLKSMLDDLDYRRNTAEGAEQLEYIRKKLEQIRVKAYRQAEKKIRQEAFELMPNEVKWARRVLLAFLGSHAADIPDSISEAKQKRIVKNAVIQNKSWEEWWTHTADADVQRIAEMVNEGVNQGWTIAEMARNIMGTKKENYSDGILSTNRAHARSMARTICSGIANQAKDDFFRSNSDVCTGVEWLDTLDGRTCMRCAPLSRKRWKIDEPHPVPPLHPNCRCVLLPVTPASDFADEQRPAAKSDFMADAKRAYEEKYPKKTWEDLVESTRQKYYYDAIRDYEKRTGEPAFEQVSGGMTFKEYFETVMTEQQRKEWLGPARYKMYLKGRKFSDFITPWPQKTMTVKQLKALDLTSFER